MKRFRLFLVFALLLSAACSGLPELVETPVPTRAPTGTAAPLRPTSTPAAQTTPDGPVMLRIWVPPQFDPYADTEAGKLLLARLEEFAARRPRMRLDIRVKALQEPGGILDALTTTSAAAPLAMPDLLLLPHPLMEAAALKGLLVPFDNLSTAMEAPDWYDYARQLARLQNSTFGIPFAGDGLLMVYRPDQVGEPPRDWQGAQQMQLPLAFPVADPRRCSPWLCTRQLGGGFKTIRGDRRSMPGH
jgi:multiple sugar transport system substrate-binding protein